MNKPYRIFVINPGSTSTKLALFEDEKCVYKCNVFHDSTILLTFPTLNDQLDYRLNVIVEFLKENSIDLHGIDAIVARGGSAYAMESGIYEISEQLVKDIHDCKGGMDHASNLGVQLANELHKMYGGIMLTADPICVDEFSDLARMTGIKGVYRKSHIHALNMRGTAKMHAEKMGEVYEENNYVVAHIDGGITVTAHDHGRMVDGNDGTGGDGPYTPSRIGQINVTDLLDYIEGKDLNEVRKLCVRSGGFTSHLGTSDSDKIHKMVEAGDKEATRVWNGMIYNTIKMIGSMSVVLKGDIKAIILTGGLMRFDDIAEKIKEHCSFIAPIYVYPNEVENEVLAQAGLDVLTGKVKPKTYTGKPVWNGFEDQYLR